MVDTLGLDSALLVALQTMNKTVSTVADTESLQNDRAAFMTYRELVSREETTAWENLDELIGDYDAVARKFPGTLYGEHATIRRESLMWETGRTR